MKPPMNDLITYKQPLMDQEGNVQKDGRGFPVMQTISVLGRVKEDTTLIIDEDGQERQCVFQVSIPAAINPTLGDEVTVDQKTAAVIKIKPIHSWSGKKTYYWVIHCGT